MKVGLLPLARATFDVPFAEERFAAMLATLDAAGVETVGEQALLFDGGAATAAIERLAAEGVDALLVLQVTFTDASTVAQAAERLGTPVRLWAIPEPRAGGRLRLNSFCGLNLASHALSRRGIAFGALYADPSDDPDVAGLLAGEWDRKPLAPSEARPSERGHAAVERLVGKRIARLGEHPDGFDTCAYDASALQDLAGVEIEEHGIDALFDRARRVEDASAARADAEHDVDGLEGVDPVQLDRSLRLRTALDAMRKEGRFDAFAIRCWPETFTEYGGAVCGPVSQLGERRTPCACEADVYGALTQLLLQDVADAPVFLVDLVDLDPSDDTGVVWHCGQAPISMASPDHRREATIHTNRKQPLLYEFPLKPGRVTAMRISQAGDEPRMVIAGGEMLARGKAFTGTSGVVRFDRGADEMLRFVVDSGLEHHVAIAYGDHRETLRGAAGALGIGVLEP